MKLLSDKVAIITGANRGLGFAIVENFLREEATIIACSRELTIDFLNHMAALSERYNKTILPIQLDLSSDDSIKEAVQNIKKSGLNPDILINNAGMIKVAPYFFHKKLDFQNIFSVNLFGVHEFTQQLSRFFIKKKQGCIVFISSISANDGSEGRLAYASSKAAINGMMRVMSKELAPYGIRVNSISPGLISTRMLSDNAKVEEINHVVTQKISLRRLGEVDEVARVVVFLSSGYASYITGQEINVDGGML